MPKKRMPESLADSLAIVAPSVPGILVSPSALRRLSRKARQLAPVHRAGFECHLHDTRRHADLQQCITRRDSEPQRVAAHLRDTGLSAYRGWRRIHDFFLAWSEHDLGEEIIECWLEYEHAATRTTPPSVFLTLDHRGAARDAARVLRRALSLLAPEQAADHYAAAVADVASRLPAGVRLLDIGLMARQPASLRVNVGGVSATRLATLLGALGWSRGELVRIAEFARCVEPFAPQVKLALDWRRGLRSRAALEIFPVERNETRPASEANVGWQGLLGWLCAQEYCDALRAGALLDWPGQVEPPEHGAAWPESLVLESLARGPRAFSVIERRLSHLKVDFVPGLRASVKAYFGFVRLWRDANPVVASRSCPRRLRSAIARGTRFLLAQRLPGGDWHDFADLDGGSGEWISGYVAAALAMRAGGAARRAAGETWERLCGLGARQGWGYNAQIPVDADSTLWTLRLAASVGRLRDPVARSGLALLRRHRTGDGGVATFLPESVGASKRGPASRSVAGWCRSHAEVTAAAGALPGFAQSSARWLLRAQKPDGRWGAYWYDEDAIATALAAEHLAGRPGPAPRRALARAAGWALARVSPDGAVEGTGRSGRSAVAAACCLRTLLAAPKSDATSSAIVRLCDWLVSVQCFDGGWRGSAPLRLPLPEDTCPATFGRRLGFARDDRGLFTTATVVDALSRCAAARRRA